MSDTFSHIYDEQSRQSDLFSVSSKMSVDTCPLDTPQFTAAFDEMVSQLKQPSYLRPTWAPANSANESSSWVTPKASTGGPESQQRKQDLGRTESGGSDLQAQVAIWQTPATDSFRSRGGDRKDEQGLDQQARLWATPQSRDFKSGEAIRSNEELYGTTGRPPTAQIREFHTGRPDPVSANSGNESSNDGPNSPRLWPTPRVNERGDYTCDKGNPESRRPTLDGLAKDGTARKLNYRFVSWLMGLHPEWVSLIPLERKSYERWVDRSSLLVRQWLSAYSRSVRASARSIKTADSD